MDRQFTVRRTLIWIALVVIALALASCAFLLPPSTLVARIVNAVVMNVVNAFMTAYDLVLRDFGWPTLVLIVAIVAIAVFNLVHGLITGRASDRRGILLGVVIVGGWLLTGVLSAIGIH
jgi:hypothetical protein